MENTENTKQEENQTSSQLQQEYLALANPGVMNHQIILLTNQISQSLNLIMEQMKKSNQHLEQITKIWDKIAGSGS